MFLPWRAEGIHRASRAIVPEGSMTRLLSFCPGGACVRRSLFTVSLSPLQGAPQGWVDSRG